MARLKAWPSRPMAEILAVASNAPDDASNGKGTWSNIVLWHVQHQAVTRVLTLHCQAMDTICFSPDGTLLAVKGWQSSSGGMKYVCLVAETESGKLLRSMTLNGARDAGMEREMYFLPGDAQLAFVNGYGIQQWNARTGESVRVVHKLLSYPSLLDFSADGTVGIDEPTQVCSEQGVCYPGPLEIWDARTGKQRGLIHPPISVPVIEALDLSPDGTRLATLSNRYHILLFQTSTGRLLNSIEIAPEASIFTSRIKLSPDKKLVAVSIKENAIGLWNTQTGQLARTLKANVKNSDHFIFSPNGDFLASSSLDGSITLWRIH